MIFFKYIYASTYTIYPPHQVFLLFGQVWKVVQSLLEKV